MLPNRTIRAGATQSLPVAQEIVDTVREAYLAQPGAMLISGVTLNPLEVLAVHASTGQSFRVPVMTKADGALNFGAPIRNVPGGAPSLPVAASGQAPNRGLADRDRQRIAAAVARGAIPPERAAFYVDQARAGRDITALDQLVPVAPGAPGKVTAAASGKAPEEGYAEYHALFGSVQEGERRADELRAAARQEVAALTEDGLYERMFEPGKPRTAGAPVSASAPGGAGQHRQEGTGPQRRYRVHAPQVSLRVPRSPDGLAAGADPAQTSWRVVELRGGDQVPPDAHPADVERLLHQKNRLGSLIKPC